MPEYLRSTGPILINNGYYVVPIRSGEKRPAIPDWQNARLSTQECAQYPGCGVGVLCGQGNYPIAAIDIDTKHPELSRRFTEWCTDTLGLTCARVGEAPKTMLVYRAGSAGWGKATGAWFIDDRGEKHRVEILGHGQQFVAYHIHPQTKRPYAWVDVLGGIEYMPACDLPVISKEQVKEALEVFERMALDCGLTRKTNSATHTLGDFEGVADDDPLMNYTPHEGLTVSDAKELLDYIDSEDYDTWLKVGMCLHFEFEGRGEGLALWDEWSSNAANYQSFDDLEYRWSGFRTSRGKVVTSAWLRKASRDGKEALEKAGKRSILEEAKQLIQNCADSSDLMYEVAPKAGAMVGGDVVAQTELEGLICSKFKEITNSKNKLPIHAIRSALNKNIPKEERKNRLLTDMTNVEMFVKNYRDVMRFVPDAGREGTWLRYNGAYWERVNRATITGLIMELAQRLPELPKDAISEGEVREYENYVKRSRSSSGVDGVARLLKGVGELSVKPQNLDARTELMCCKNGPVELYSGQLLEPNPAQLLTMTTNVNYDPRAKAPLFEQVISDAFFDDIEMVGFFQRLIGYSLLGDPVEQIMPILVGGGANGKSTIMNAIEYALGDYTASVAASTFLSKGVRLSSPGGARGDLTRLNNKRLVIVGEPDGRSSLREDQVKLVTGGDTIVARTEYSIEHLQFKAKFVAFILTNPLPDIEGTDDGIWRRIMLVRFGRNFLKDPTIKCDPDLPKKLEAEAPGIFTCCVRWCMDYLKNGLCVPERVREWNAEYRAQSDPIGMFLKERCEFGEEYDVTSRNLYSEFVQFLREQGDDRYIPGQRNFTNKLRDRESVRYSENVADSTSSRGRSCGFRGIRVVSGSEDF